MAKLRRDHVGVVVDDLENAKAFFVALGMEVEGEVNRPGISGGSDVSRGHGSWCVGIVGFGGV